MDADQQQHQSSSVIKQSKTKLTIKFRSGNINQPQQQCSSSKEAEMVVMNNMSVSKSISDSSSLSTTCSICGKCFPSKQSLFGHMRSHPDREYRGIQPPSSPLQSQPLRLLIKNSSPSSTGSDDSSKSAESYQGVGPLPVKWSATGKRGRQPYGSFLSSDERIGDAIKGLLMLKEGNDLDVAAAALMNKQISRETEGICTSKKRIESSSSEEEQVSDLLRSSKKIKIDEVRSFSQLEQLPSNLFKKLKLGDERIGCSSSSSSMFDPKLMNTHLEQFPLIEFHGGDDFTLVQNSSKKAKLIPSSSIPSSSSSSHVPHMPPNGSHSIPSSSSTHVPHMPPNGSHSIPSSSSSHVPPHSSIPSSSSSSHGIPHMPLQNGYFQGEFNSGFIKPSILSKSTTTNKKKVDQRGSSAAAKCDTCNRTFSSHQALGGHKSSSSCKNNSNYQYPTYDHQYLLCRESIIPKLMFQADVDHEHPKIPTTSYGTHKCELCGETFGTGQALGGHKRRHYTGYSTGTAPAPVEKVIKKEMMNSLSVVDAATTVASSEVISTTTTTTTTTTKTESKTPRVLDFDLNELPDESWI